ncbi:hypothetical protein [Cohnella sp. AR92]|uniref:hypothetical protein n=1 Tax=Cohnella sp. AR92 TaxID=648716 RepID=UPI000F8F14B5|nr:hypothetical protein [Cohnella sp. AR92]RUS46739.1 hypothetical protein ELR57_13660 [Cohnella sp. AR92]
MKKYLSVIGLCFLMAGCSNSSATSEPISSEATQQVISESQDKSVQILADTKATGEMFTGLTVKIRNQEKKFPWKNVANPTYSPEIYVENMDNGPENEIIIVLTSGYGTGVQKTELHALKNDYYEFSVQDPVQAVRSSVKSSHEINDGKHRFSLSYKGKTLTKEYGVKEAGLWFDDVVFGNIVRYRIEDKQVIAEVPAQVSPGNFMATVEAEFQMLDQSLTVGELSLQEVN